MAISARLLLLITFAIFSILSVSIYIYSKNYQNPVFFNIKLPTSNGTKPASDKTAENTVQKGNLGFIHAFIASISVIVVSELGDKTFFIAAILAMRHSRLIIYTGAMSALGAMTILSALLGNIVTKFISRVYTYYLSSILFAGFGVKMLKDGYGMSADEGTEEYEEVQNEVEKAEAKEDAELGDGETADNSSRMNQQQQRLSKRSSGTFVVVVIRRYISPIFIQAFIMTFLAVSSFIFVYLVLFCFHR